MKVIRTFNAQPVKIPHFKSLLTHKQARWPHFFYCSFIMFISWMFITPSFKKGLIVEQFQGNYLKVAEHSFSARFCWCKLARVQGFQKTNMPSTERSFYSLNTRTICVIFLYNCMQCIDDSSILLQRCVTKGNVAKNPAFLAFVCCRKNPVKCNACAVARNIETDCFSRNVPFSSDPVVRISRNLAKK